MFLCSTQCPKHATCNMCRRSHASLEDEQSAASKPEAPQSAAPLFLGVSGKSLSSANTQRAFQTASVGVHSQEPPVSEFLPSNSGLAKAHKFNTLNTCTFKLWSDRGLMFLCGTQCPKHATCVGDACNIMCRRSRANLGGFSATFGCGGNRLFSRVYRHGLLAEFGSLGILSSQVLCWKRLKRV